MAQIGDLGEKKWKLYIVNKADDPPTISSKFTDYTGYFIDWKAQGSINKLASFKGTLIDINTTTKRGNGLVITAATIAKGNLIYLMSGTKLIGKFVINKPIFRTNFTVEISATQSTGSEIINRKLANENMPKVAYEDITFNNILTSTSSTCQGLLVDGSENTILSSTVSSGADDRYSLDYDYDNRIKAVDKLVNTAGKEWYIEYGTNDDTPYNDGDTLNIASRQGSAVSTKTFYFTSTNMNAQISEGGEETETNANHIIVEGQDQSNNQVVSEATDFSGNYSCITAEKGLDGWLTADIDTAGCYDPITEKYYIPVSLDSFGHFLMVYGGGIMVSIDNEAIKIDDVVTASTERQLMIDSRGVYNTEASPHKKGADVIFVAGLDSGSVIKPVRIYVDDVSCFCKTNNHLVTIGKETMLYQYDLSDSCKTPGADYIVANRIWGEQYAHGDKIIIKEGGCYPLASPSSWSPANPHNELNFAGLSGFTVGETITGLTSNSTGIVTAGSVLDNTLNLCDISGDFTSMEAISGSVTGTVGLLCMGYHTNSIQQNGLFSKTLSDNTAKNRHMLDLKAQRILLTKRLPIKRISINVIEPISIWGDVSLGDTITLGDGSSIGFDDSEEVRITGWEYSFQGGMPRLELFCNDKETRTYPSTKTNYVDEKITSEEPKTQEPLRLFGNAGSLSASEGTNAKWSQGYKQVTEVMSPVDDFDASNKKYVNETTAAAGQWARSSCYVYPKVTTDKVCGPVFVGKCLCVCTCVVSDLVPDQTGAEGSDLDLGKPYAPWNALYASYVDGDHYFNTISRIMDDNNNHITPDYGEDSVKICGTGGITTGWSYGGNYICIDGSAISAGCWESVGTTAIKPIESRSLYPNYANSCNVGYSTCRWNTAYFRCGDFCYRFKLPVGTNMY